MQKGFATLEIILSTLIIVLLMTVAIPNAVRVVDTVKLDYETKRLYTQLKFLQSFDRMTGMTDSHFYTDDKKGVVSLEIIDNRYYVLKKRSYPEKIYEQHSLPSGFSFRQNANVELRYIKFDDMGKPRSAIDTALNGHIRIISRFDKFYIYFNTVGRISGSRTER